MDAGAAAWVVILLAFGLANLPFFNDTGLGYSALRVLAGLALIPIAAWASRALAAGTARLAKLTLG